MWSRRCDGSTFEKQPRILSVGFGLRSDGRLDPDAAGFDMVTRGAARQERPVQMFFCEAAVMAEANNGAKASFGGRSSGW